MRFWFIAISLVLMACAGTAGESSLRCADCPEAQVERINDGHNVDTSLGRISLFGVDTPERGEPCYDQVNERLRELLGDVVRVEPGPRSADSLGRLLYYIYTRDGTSVDAALIAEGLGAAWRQDGQHRDYLVDL
jgi:endonuclease YncB( thermonuclease family)